LNDPGRTTATVAPPDRCADSGSERLPGHAGAPPVRLRAIGPAADRVSNPMGSLIKKRRKRMRKKKHKKMLRRTRHQRRK
jgi:hypothetical protein